MDAALLAMISTLFVAMLGNAWHQTRENTKTRDLMIQLNNGTRSELSDLGAELRADHKALDTKLSGEIKALDTKLSGEISALDAKLSGENKALDDGLGSVRERLSRIEGHLGIGLPGVGASEPPEPPVDE